MKIKQRLFTNMFLRNMLGSFGFRSRHYSSQKDFIPYFQYKIGEYQEGEYLYFPCRVTATKYTNEIFNKLSEYKGYEVIQYLEFHYFAFPNKTDFLRFLLYESSERIKLQLPKTFQARLQMVIEWIAEKQQEQRNLEGQEFTRRNQQDVASALGNDYAEKQTVHEAAVNVISDQMANRLEIIMSDTEQKMEALTTSFITGNIELNNHNHQERLIRLLILISTVQAPKEVTKGEQLFKRFSFTDLASLLHLHFEAFKNKKLNTIQVNIKECNESVNLNNPKVQKLINALQDFFY